MNVAIQPQMQVDNKSIITQEKYHKTSTSNYRIVVDLLQSIPKLQNPIELRENETMHATNQLESNENEDPMNEPPLSGEQVIDPMLVIANTTKKPTVVNMEILGRNLTNTIANGMSSMNILTEDTWRSLSKPTIWSPTFQLLGADHQGIKGTWSFNGKKVIIETQAFLLNFVVISLSKKAYNELLGWG